MSDRRQRIEDALRKGVRAEPPEGLDREIKKEIPDLIVSKERGPGGTGWLIAAAIVLMLGGGWLATRLISQQPVQKPAARIAEQRPGERDDLESEPGREQPSKSELSATMEEEFEAPSTPPPLAEPKASAVADSDVGGYAPEPQSERSIDRLDQPATPKPATLAARQKTPEGSRESDEKTTSAPPDQSIEAEEVSRVTGSVVSGVLRDATAPAEEAAASRELRVEEQVARSNEERKRQAAGEKEDAGPLSYGEIRSTIFADRLPDPDRIDVNAIIGQFDYGDRPPWRRGMVSLFLEGGAAPFSPSRWRTVRIGLRSRSTPSAVAEAATLRIDVDPEAVSIYRRIGDQATDRAASHPSVAIDLGGIDPDDARSWFLEVKLRPDLDLDQVVVRAVLEYTRNGRRSVLERNLKVGHVAPSWRSTSSSLQLGILAGAWGELLSGERHMTNLAELAYVAGELVPERSDEEKAAELVRLVERTVALERRSRRR